MKPPVLSAADREQLDAAGISIEEAERQLRLLAAPPPPRRLARPARLGDGIETLAPEREASLLARAAGARDAGRFSKFVPASGAATRMFRALHIAEEAPATLAALPATAAGREMLRRAEREGFAAVSEWLASPAGQAFMALPKALLPFHVDGDRPRTAFAEQLAEGGRYVSGRDSAARFHFTIPEGERRRFEAELEAARGGHLSFDVRFSEQLPSTHALALDETGQPARAVSGRDQDSVAEPGGSPLMLRPSGHGALLANLAQHAVEGGDVVFLKNIDNVLPAARHAEVARWKLLLAGRLLEIDESRADRARPLRVCGVVANTGEPGGGPFWVERPDGGATLQIVESAEIDLADPGQRAIWHASTHFNPVDLVVALRDAHGVPHELTRFVDPAAAFVATKFEGGRKLRVYERPGLWNGAMAEWETHFVEVPAWTFAPVKTLLDLARPEHRVDSGSLSASPAESDRGR
jgi:hypothetical protein